MSNFLNIIEKAVVEHSIGFLLGTVFGMWLIVAADCYIRAQCR